MSAGFPPARQWAYQMTNGDLIWPPVSLSDERQEFTDQETGRAYGYISPVLVVRDTDDVVVVSRADLQTVVSAAGWGTKTTFPAIERVRAALSADRPVPEKGGDADG